jgi:hypothetical protein
MVSELAADLKGSAIELLECLRNRRVKGFYTAKIEELEAFLLAEGYLDDREPLSEVELLERLHRELSAELGAGDLETRDLDELLFQMLA